MTSKTSESAIEYIIVIPKTPRMAAFYVNNNLSDGHYMEYEKLYRFIATLLSPPAILNVRKYISMKTPFYVMISENIADELSFDSATRIEELKRSSKQNLNKEIPKILRQKKQEEQDRHTPRLHDRISSIIDQTMNLFPFSNGLDRTNVDPNKKSIVARRKKSRPKVYDKL